MATICLIRFLVRPPRLIFLRLLRHESQLSTERGLRSNTTPIKYTTNKAAKIPITETLGLEGKDQKAKSEGYERYIYVGSLSIFLLYFCVLREENDFDEILNGDTNIPSKELYQLKLSLSYCEKHKLPTEALKAKIKELEGEKKIVSPFIK